MSIMGNNICERKGREGEDLEMKLTNDNTLTILTLEDNYTARI
jgi:hypothetical protein